MGQFLFSQTSQALSQSTPGRRVHVFMPEATFAHAIGRYVTDNGLHNWPEDEVSANGARDIGIELFDWAEFKNDWFGSKGPLEFTYSADLATVAPLASRTATTTIASTTGCHWPSCLTKPAARDVTI